MSNHRPVAQVSAYLAQVGRDLRRESAPGAILVAQVPHLKWNLLHPSRHQLHKSTLNVSILAQVHTLVAKVSLLPWRLSVYKSSI